MAKGKEADEQLMDEALEQGPPPGKKKKLLFMIVGLVALVVVAGGGAPTIAEARDETLMAAKAEAKRNPLVQAILAAFPGTDVAEVRTPEAMAATAAVEALPEVEDEWDPFEDN